MLLIAHRGNLEGPSPNQENDPFYLDQALTKGYDVEIDLRYIDGQYFLGHDLPQYPVSLDWLSDRSSKLWIHCKNSQALTNLINNDNFNIFWHNTDDLTLTSHGHIWAYPGKQPVNNSIAVMPELYNDSLHACKGICTDFVFKYQKRLSDENF